MAVKKTGPGGVASEPQATGFKITGGTTTQKVLTVSADVTLDQDLQQSASPTFAGITIDTDGITDIDTAADGLAASDAHLPTSSAVTAAITAYKFPYTEKTAAFDIAVQNSYGMNQSGGVCAGTLPATAAIGDKAVCFGVSADLFQIVAGAGQTIKCNNLTTKTAGYVKCLAQYGVIEVECIVANTTWLAHTNEAVDVEVS